MSKFNADSVEIEDYVQEIAKNSRVTAFYPQTISRKLNIPVDIVLIELSDPKYSGKIDLRYDIKCLDDLSTIATVDDYKELIGKEILCEICGEKIKITYNNVYPIFHINLDYKEYLKKKS